MLTDTICAEELLTYQYLGVMCVCVCISCQCTIPLFQSTTQLQLPQMLASQISNRTCSPLSFA